MQFFYDSYGNIRFPFGSSKTSNTVELIHDAFQPLSFWNNKFTSSEGFQGVMMDTHIYQMFSNDVRPMLKWPFCFNVDRLWITISQLVALSNSAHISTACDHAQDLSTFDLWIVAGEWTPAATDCGAYKLSAHAG